MNQAEPVFEEEKTLLINLRQGQSAAFEQLYHRYKSPIYYNLIRIVRVESIAEELLQDVFMKVWESRESIDPEKSFRSFLFRIAGNLAIDFHRKAARQKMLEAAMALSETELYDHIESGINFKESEALLNHAIEKLPPQRQKIFRMCRIDGKSYDETAALLGLSKGTVHDHIIKANRFLREELSKDLGLYLLLVAAAFSFAG